MKTELGPKFKAYVTGLTTVTLLFTTAAQADNAPTALEYTRLLRDGVLVLYGSSTEKIDESHIRFAIDITNITPWDYMTNNNIAIIPSNHTAPKDRLCPYFNLATRDYSIEKDKNAPSSKKVLFITAKVSEQEVEAVKRAECVITNWPSYERLQPFI